jgi:opacity protein-like surface antigen
MKTWTIAAALAAALISSAGVAAQQTDKVPLKAADYAEINQLYVRYNYGIDTHADGGQMWSKTFTPDGVFELVGSMKIQGFDKLTEFAKLKLGAPAPDAPHHYATNIMINPAPGGATGSAYFFNVTTPEKGKGSTITGTGTYKDFIVKTAEGWRFKQRSFYSNALPPAMIGEVSAR